MLPLPGKQSSGFYGIRTSAFQILVWRHHQPHTKPHFERDAKFRDFFLPVGEFNIGLKLGITDWVVKIEILHHSLHDVLLALI